MSVPSLHTAEDRRGWIYTPAYMRALGSAANASAMPTDEDDEHTSPLHLLANRTEPQRWFDLADLPTAPAWMNAANCVGDSADLTTTAGRATIERLCGRCSVRGECLEYAVANGIEHGVWGGLRAEDRKRAGLRPAERRLGLLYAIAFAGNLKVGWTNHPRRRFTSLANAAGVTLADVEVLHTMPGSMADENALHKRLRPWGMTGRSEYYRDCPEVRAALTAEFEREVAA